jgi:sugar phosphate isomerase/epimerase
VIYLSTGGWSNSTAFESAERLVDNGMRFIEFSGGKYDPHCTARLCLMAQKCDIQIHNYFPPPADPFVFNLASLVEDVANKSMLHATRAIELASILGLGLYSFHAGFLLDPNVRDLGEEFKVGSVVDREIGLNLFLERVNELSQFASRLGIRLLIENNVLSSTNQKAFDGNPFLMADHHECSFVMRNTPENVSLLLDVAHLNVSSNSLAFSKIEFIEMANEYTFAYHLSDNDGLSDSNEPVTTDSWFWPYIRKDLTYYTLEVYGVSVGELKRQVELTERILLS